MTLIHFSSTAFAASLAFACVPAQEPPKFAEQPPSAHYVTITPHVSVSANAQPLPEPPALAEVHEGQDVMAEILALPPGASRR